MRYLVVALAVIPQKPPGHSGPEARTAWRPDGVDS